MHVIQEDGTFVKSINLRVDINRLYIRDLSIWIAAFSGLYTLTVDTDYDITASTLLVLSDSQFEEPYGVSLFPTSIVVVCQGSHNVHYFSHNGTRLFPPVGGQGSGDGHLDHPYDITNDACGLYS